MSRTNQDSDMEDVGCARMPTDEGRKEENSLMYRKGETIQ